jgi:hypothetical protein
MSGYRVGSCFNRFSIAQSLSGSNNGTEILKTDSVIIRNRPSKSAGMSDADQNALNRTIGIVDRSGRVIAVAQNLAIVKVSPTQPHHAQSGTKRLGPPEFTGPTVLGSHNSAVAGHEGRRHQPASSTKSGCRIRTAPAMDCGSPASHETRK